MMQIEKTQNKCQPYFDFLRGIGALMVVSLNTYICII